MITTGSLIIWLVGIIITTVLLIIVQKCVVIKKGCKYYKPVSNFTAIIFLIISFIPIVGLIMAILSSIFFAVSLEVDEDWIVRRDTKLKKKLFEKEITELESSEKSK